MKVLSAATRQVASAEAPRRRYEGKPHLAGARHRIGGVARWHVRRQELSLVELSLVELSLVELSLVEPGGLEPPTSALQRRRSPG